MVRIRVENKKYPKRSSWVQWLKEQKLSLAQEDTHCHDPAAITARSGDQNFVGVFPTYNPGVLPVFIKKARRKSKCYQK